MAWTPAPPYTMYDPPQRPIVWVLDCVFLFLLPTMFTNVVLFAVQSTKHQTNAIGVLDGAGGTLVLTIVIGLCYAVLLSRRAPRRPRLATAFGALALVPVFLALFGGGSLPAMAAETFAPTVAGVVILLAVLFRALRDWPVPLSHAAWAVPLAAGIWLAVGIADATGVDPRLGYPIPAEPSLYAVTVAMNQDWLGRRWFPPELAAPSLVIYAVAAHRRRAVHRAAEPPPAAAGPAPRGRPAPRRHHMVHCGLDRCRGDRGQPRDRPAADRPATAGQW